MKFIRPDWKKPKPYSDLLGTQSGRLIAWEFLRRNPDYEKDLIAFRATVDRWYSEAMKSDIGPTVKEYADGSIFHNMWYGFIDLAPDKWHASREYFWAKWGLSGYVDLDDDGGPEVFVSRWEIKPDDYIPVRDMCQRIETPLVSIPVDLSESIEQIEKSVMHLVRLLRANGIKSGAITPNVNRVLDTRKYINHLRMLDATFAGASIQEIGEILLPHATNDPNDKQRDKRIRAALKAAQKMQDSGYKILI